MNTNEEKKEKLQRIFFCCSHSTSNADRTNLNENSEETTKERPANIHTYIQKQKKNTLLPDNA